jgi:DNA polymerase III epsilon subunit-like protein
MNYNDIVVFDFETGGLDTQTCAVLQVAAQAIQARSLKFHNNGFFQSYIKPPGPKETWKIDPRALEVNKITYEQIEAAPGEAEVWKAFASFLKRYNAKGSPYTAPIPAGQNIRNYDLPISNRLCTTYGFIDKKDGTQNIWNRRNVVDLIDISFLWFENQVEPADHKLDTLRAYFGITAEGAHNAKKDVQDTAEIIIRMMELHRRLTPSIPFKGAWARNILPFERTK